MEAITLGQENFGDAIFKAVGVLRRGGVILYPTDTLYGLGADAFSDEAVEKVYSIKGRESGKPMHCIVANLAMAAEYAEVNTAAQRLAEKFLPGPLTLVLRKKSGINTGIVRGLDTIGIRIPANDYCIEVAKSFGRPFTATSANKADEPPELSVENILQQLGDRVRMIDLVIDAGILPLRPPSTVVNVVSGSPSILREGVIARSSILSVFQVG